jgi:hypothetical protein
MVDRYLVIGGGCAGTAAIRAIRRQYSRRFDEVHIIATTKNGREVDGANAVLPLQLHDGNIELDDWLKPLMFHRPYKATFITPAYGRVGIPISSATEGEKREAFNYSVRPMLRLEAAGGFGKLVVFSTFHWQRFIEQTYGAVGYSKREQLEPLCRQNPGQRQLVRFGAIESPSLRGIAMAAMLLIKNGKLAYADFLKLLTLVPNAQGMSIPQAMFEQIRAEERQLYQVERNTTPQDLEEALLDWLQHPVHKTLNVMGNLRWYGDERIPEERILPRCVELHRRFCPTLWDMPIAV